jgi:hypothetical protein
MYHILYVLRNEFAYDSFCSIRNLALRAAALKLGKASFFGGIPLGPEKLYSSKLFLNVKCL